MHLKSVTLRGFKSFASSMTLRFEPGITAADATGHRCERCWKWQEKAPLCARCDAAVGGKS